MPVGNNIEVSKRSAKLPVVYSNRSAWWKRLFRTKSIFEQPLPDYHPIQRLHRILRQTQHFHPSEH